MIVDGDSAVWRMDMASDVCGCVGEDDSGW